MVIGRAQVCNDIFCTTLIRYISVIHCPFCISSWNAKNLERIASYRTNYDVCASNVVDKYSFSLINSWTIHELANCLHIVAYQHYSNHEIIILLFYRYEGCPDERCGYFEKQASWIFVRLTISFDRVWYFNFEYRVGLHILIGFGVLGYLNIPSTQNGLSKYIDSVSFKLFSYKVLSITFCHANNFYTDSYFISLSKIGVPNRKQRRGKCLMVTKSKQVLDLVASIGDLRSTNPTVSRATANAPSTSGTSGYFPDDSKLSIQSQRANQIQMVSKKNKIPKCESHIRNTCSTRQKHTNGQEDGSACLRESEQKRKDGRPKKNLNFEMDNQRPAKKKKTKKRKRESSKKSRESPPENKHRTRKKMKNTKKARNVKKEKRVKKEKKTRKAEKINKRKKKKDKQTNKQKVFE